MDIKRLNDTLMNPNSTEDASKRIDSNEKFEELCQSYQQIAPYVKTVRIQSVIFLDDKKFHEIRHSFQKFIALAIKDEDEWVRRTAQIFQNYPEMEIPDDFIIQGPLQEGDDFVDPFQAPYFTVPSVQHFNYDDKLLLKPPSSNIEEPKNIPGQAHRVPQQNALQQPPRPPMQPQQHQLPPQSFVQHNPPQQPPPQQPPHQHHSKAIPFAPPSEAKKEKKVLPLMPPINSQKMEPKVDQPKKEKKTKKIISFKK